MRRTVVLLIALLMISAPSFAALLNGDMELGTVGIAGSHTDATRLTNWSIYDEHGSQIDHSLAYGIASPSYTTWTMTMASYSGYSVYMKHKGLDASGGYWGIYQTVDTVAGHSYTLTSMINSNSNLTKGASTYWGYYLFVTNGPGFIRPDTLSAYASGKSDNLSDTGKTVGWEQRSASFTAQSSQTTFAWISLVNSAASASAGHLFGVDSAVLTDNTPIPEPGSLLALGAGLVGLAGMIRRKR